MDADWKGAGNRTANFKLAAGGETLALANDQGMVIDQVDFGPQRENVTQGRWPDGSEDVFDFVLAESPGWMNGLDADLDGLPDLWELEFGFNPSAIGEAFLDMDADGHSSYQEYLANTDPSDATDLLAIDQSWISENQLGLSFQAKQGRAYQIQQSQDLSMNQWETLWEVDVMLDDRELSLEIPLDSSSSPQRYIRLRAKR